MSVIRKVMTALIPDRDIGDNIKIRCVFHDENTPSLNINDEGNYCKCFGCGGGGTPINTVLQYKRDVERYSDFSYRDAIDWIKENTGLKESEIIQKNMSNTSVVHASPPLDKAVIKELLQQTGTVSHGYRGIRDEINTFYGHLTKLDSNGNVLARYYPETNDDGKITGFKCRNHPKDFSYGKIGVTGGKSQLSGQFLFNSGGKYVCLVGGEEDKAAAFQMLRDSQIERGQDDYSGIAVVSPTVGESSCIKQVAAQYDWFDSFDIIIIGMDNDDVGKKAAMEIAQVLPKEKVRIALWSKKDPNKMLEDGLQRQFMRDFYNAKEFVSSGIQSSSDLLPQIIEELLTPRITLPPYMHVLQKNLKGGFQQGRIINIIGDTSVGKSTHVNNLVYHWIFNAPQMVGVVSLEATAGQYGLDMLSIHLEKNFAWWNDGNEVIDYLHREDVQEAYSDLFTDEYGSPRFMILDERDGDIKKVEKQLERLVHQYGCKIIVLDVLTDLIRHLPNEGQEMHMGWQKRFVKEGVTIVNVLHTRKPPVSNEGGFRKCTEYDALGSGTVIQSGAYNVVINRDKMASSIIERNLTMVDLPKGRNSTTGEAGLWYYDVDTRKTYDYDDWLSMKRLAAPTPPEEKQDEPKF